MSLLPAFHHCGRFLCRCAVRHSGAPAKLPGSCRRPAFLLCHEAASRRSCQLVLAASFGLSSRRHALPATPTPARRWPRHACNATNQFGNLNLQLINICAKPHPWRAKSDPEPPKRASVEAHASSVELTADSPAAGREISSGASCAGSGPIEDSSCAGSGPVEEASSAGSGLASGPIEAEFVEGAFGAAGEAEGALFANPQCDLGIPDTMSSAGLCPHWEVRCTIQLSKLEEEIFGELLGAVSMFGLKTQLRVAGGWVRDKLLGKECFDIDVALDDIMGREFADKVNQYLASKGQVARGVGVIRSNPEQSKHLETATMMIHGQWIDLVNLRAESYADEGSRIPSAVEFGTAEQDAYRRDLTINSLFYNITTRTIEDWTKSGIADLKEGVIRTPLPPVQTFLDDPLRVLRAIRFGARLGFRLDPDLIAAARNDDVRSALATKVSRERVGKELEGMLKGRDPLLAVSSLYSLGIFPTVFSLPGPDVLQPADVPADYEKLGVDSLASVQRLLVEFPSAFKGASSDENASSAGDLMVCTRLAAVLLPLRHCAYQDKKKKTVPVSQFIVRESLKLKASYADTVASLHQHAEAFQSLVPLLVPGPTDANSLHATTGDEGGEGEGEEGIRGEGDTVQAKEASRNGAVHETGTGAAGAGAAMLRTEPGAAVGSAAGPSSPGQAEPGLGAGVPELAAQPRVAAGKLLRKAKGTWRSALLLCAVIGDPSEGQGAAEAKRPRTQEASGVPGAGPEWARPSAWEERCAATVERISGLGLDGVWDLKPLLNGKEVIACLDLGKGSPATGTWLERATEWQLANPSGTTDECRAWLQEMKANEK